MPNQIANTIFEPESRYMITEDRNGKFIIGKMSASGYVAIGEVYDMAEVPNIYGLINDHVDDVPLQMLQSLSDVARDHFEYVLRRCDGNLSAASRILKISVRTGRNYLKKWNIERRK